MALSANERVVIAETGDVLLTLRNPGVPFAVWERDAEDGESADKSDAERNLILLQLLSPLRSSTKGDEHKNEEQIAKEKGPPHKKRKTTRKPNRKSLKEQQDTPDNNVAANKFVDNARQPAYTSLVYQVSSQHLITASPKFKSELTS